MQQRPDKWQCRSSMAMTIRPMRADRLRHKRRPDFAPIAVGLFLSFFRLQQARLPQS